MSNIIDRKTAKCRALFEQVLELRKIDKDKYKWAAKEIYALNLDNKQMALMLLYLYPQSTTGLFCLTFGANVDNAIQQQDKDNLVKLLHKDKTVFVELYDNKELTSEELTKIKALVDREYATMLNVVESEDEESPFLTNYFGCASLAFTANLKEQDDKIKGVVLYNKCYDDICLAEGEIKKDTRLDTVLNSVKVVRTLYIAERHNDIPVVYCMTLMEVLEALNMKEPINPRSKEKLLPVTVNLLNKKYVIEKKLYKRAYS